MTGGHNAYGPCDIVPAGKQEMGPVPHLSVGDISWIIRHGQFPEMPHGFLYFIPYGSSLCIENLQTVGDTGKVFSSELILLLEFPPSVFKK